MSELCGNTKDCVGCGFCLQDDTEVIVAYWVKIDPHCLDIVCVKCLQPQEDNIPILDIDKVLDSPVICVRCQNIIERKK